METYVDIFEPGADINSSVDQLGKNIYKLYAEAWAKNKSHLYGDKPFDLNANTFVSLWLEGGVKLFLLRNHDSKEPIGFLIGVVFRPMPFKALVFHVQEYYVQGDNLEFVRMQEAKLLSHASDALRILGCDEVWMEIIGDRQPSFGTRWVEGGDFKMRRFVKNPLTNVVG